jgi:hypothetical protein
MSDDGSAGALVCGFSDLAAGIGGLAWGLAGGGGLLLNQGEVTPAEVEISEAEEGVRAQLNAGEAAVEATIVPRTGLIPLRDAEGNQPASGALEGGVCTATVRSAGWGRTLECPGHLSRWEGDPLEGAGTFRHLTGEAASGGLLIACARGKPGLEGHGDERVSAWLLDVEGGASPFGEALISTQYDEDGRPTRAGLELWPGEDAPPMRVVASPLGGGQADGIWAGLLRCHAGEVEGLGSYLLWRA